MASVDPLIQDSDYDILVIWKDKVVGQTMLVVPYPEITHFDMSYGIDGDKEWILYKISASDDFLSTFKVRVISYENRVTLASRSTTELEGQILLEYDRPYGAFEFQIWADTGKLKLPGKSIVQLRWPSASMDSADYIDSAITVAYKLNDSRPGEYVLAVLDEDHFAGFS